MSKNPIESLSRAIELAGGQSKLSRLMLEKADYKATQQAISHWIKSGKVPAAAAVAICKALDNQVKISDLFPALSEI